MTGALMIGHPESEVISGTLAAVRQHGLEHKVLRANDVRQKFPGTFNLSDDEIAIWEKDAGYLVPESCIDAFQRCAERSGNATLLFGDRMSSYSCTSDGVSVIMESGHVYQAKKIVLCVGAWAPEVLGADVMRLVPLTVVRKVLTWLEPNLPILEADRSYEATPTLFTSEALEDSSCSFHHSKFPVYIWDTGKEGAFYGFPRQMRKVNTENEGVKVAIHIMRQDLVANRQYVCNPSTIERNIDPLEIQEVRDILKDRMPSLAKGHLLKAVTCMYTCTADGHFWLDFHPLHGENVIIASPCSGHGFKMATVIGEIVKELVTTGTTKHNISLFTTKRGI